jgi:hypothetical protein
MSYPPCDHILVRAEAIRLTEMGLVIAPIIPVELDHLNDKGKPLFTGKNPSFWRADGMPQTVCHGQPPSTQQVLDAIDTAESLGKPIGLAILPGDNCTTIDFDPKDYPGGVDECRADVNRLVRAHPELLSTRMERTPSGGAHIYLRVADWADFTKPNGKLYGQFTTTPGASLRGELLTGTRVSVTAPTRIKTSDRDGAYELRGKPYNLIEVASLSAIGIYPVGSKPASTAEKTQPPLKHSNPSPPFRDAAEAPALKALIGKAAQSVLDGRKPYGKDRSSNLAGFAQEVYGCENWLNANARPYRGSADALISLAIDVLDIGDKAERVLPTLDRASCNWLQGDQNKAERRYKEVSEGRFKSPAAAMHDLHQLALKLLSEKVPQRERMPLLRTAAMEASLAMRDPDLHALFAAARKELRGDSDGISAGMELDIPDAEWVWESLIAAGTLNMVTALQKVGKTALLLQFVRLWSAGATEFLGYALTPGCPGVVIVGTDMGLADWRNMLMAAGLMEKTPAGTYKPLPPILKLWHRESPLHLDESGLDRLAAICEEHPGALVLVDSFAAVTAPLGIDEFKPEAAEPLYALCEAVEPFGATTVLIHHSSKSRSGEQASNAARGSNAITAVPSQLINLAWHGDPKQDRRVELTSEGRGALPTALVIEQIERCQWISHGDASALRRTEGRLKAEQNLNDRQGIVLDEVRSEWEEHHHEMDAIYLREALPAEFSGKDPQRQASATLEQLARKELLEKRKAKISGRGEVVLYRPHGADVRQAKLRQEPPRANAHQGAPIPPIPLGTRNREEPSDQPLITQISSGHEGSEGSEGARDIHAQEALSPGAAVELIQPDGGWQGGWAVAVVADTAIGTRVRIERPGGTPLNVPADQVRRCQEAA